MCHNSLSSLGQCVLVRTQVRFDACIEVQNDMQRYGVHAGRKNAAVCDVHIGHSVFVLTPGNMNCFIYCFATILVFATAYLGYPIA